MTNDDEFEHIEFGPMTAEELYSRVRHMTRIDDITVGSWSRDPVIARAEEVHLIIKADGVYGPIVLRIRSKETMDALIEVLTSHRDFVWRKDENE